MSYQLFPELFLKFQHASHRRRNHIYPCIIWKSCQPRRLNGHRTKWKLSTYSLPALVAMFNYHLYKYLYRKTKVFNILREVSMQWFTKCKYTNGLWFSQIVLAYGHCELCWMQTYSIVEKSSSARSSACNTIYTTWQVVRLNSYLNSSDRKFHWRFDLSYQNLFCRNLIVKPDIWFEICTPLLITVRLLTALVRKIQTSVLY